jgi:hexosaminidase
MHDFVLPYASTMKTANDNNIPMTAASRYSLNMKTVKAVDGASTRIIPAPYSMVASDNAQTFDISGATFFNLLSLGDLNPGASDLLSKLGVSTSGDHKVSFVLGTLPTDIAGTRDAYTMEVTSQGTTITAEDARGLFSGLMSFIGLLDVKDSSKMTLTTMIVHDKPRFEYRGHQIDTARNFRSKDAIMKTIDAMALWKVSNTLCEFELCDTYSI